MVLAVLPVALLLVSGGAAKLEKRTITKSSVYLVKSPSFLAAPASPAIIRGETVQVKPPAARGWFEATYKPAVGKASSGFIHTTYVTDRPVAFKVKPTEVKGESLVSGNYQLAVGGFSPEVESAYRAKNPDVDKGFERLAPFMPEDPTAAGAAVMAAPRDPEALSRFVTGGKLALDEGTGGDPARAPAPADGATPEAKP